MRKGIKIIASILLIFAVIISASGALLFGLADGKIDYSLDEELFASSKGSRYISFVAFDGDGALYEYCRPALSDQKLWCELGGVSSNMINSIISSEDRDFYNHSGVNIKRTFLALINYALSVFDKGRKSFGASTITQQVVKNISGDNDRSLSRKLNEILRARKIEKKYSKNDILEMYLNIIPLSGGINGVRLGALTYFGKEPSTLSIAESATIAGITNAPGRYDPYKHPKECLEKRNRVLYAMLDNGCISKEEYEISVNSPLGITERHVPDRAYDWFIETALVDAVKDICAKYSITERAAELMLYSGCTVYLTVNSSVQKILNEYFEDTSNLPEQVKEGLQLAFSVFDSTSGDLVGIIGGAGKKKGDRIYNLATSPHPPASALKPIALYSLALDQGLINYSSVLDDSPLYYSDNEGKPYPLNSPNIYRGPITVKDALSLSKNTVAVRLYDKLGAEYIYIHLQDKYSIDTLIKAEHTANGDITDLGPSSLGLGQLSRGISIRKLTHCYTSFPSDGYLRGGRSYYCILDGNGNVILNNTGMGISVMQSESARIMCQLLSSVAKDGTARNLTLKHYVDTGAKTGTSGNDLDRLLVGFTPYFTAGIWMGYSAGNKSIESVSVSHIKIWDEVMLRIHEKCVFDNYSENIKVFNTDGLVEVPYCKHSGLLPDEFCTDIEYGYYTENNLPYGFCQVCKERG